MQRIRLALVGIGGYGRVHVNAALELVKEGFVDIKAFVEPKTDLPAAVQLAKQGIRGYASVEELLQNETSLDLLCVATPIHTHVSIAAAAFKKGLHVFLEKPPAVRIQDLRYLIKLADQHRCLCVVGFHDIARDEIRQLKDYIVSKKLGQIQSINAWVLWRRTDKYYNRSNWAGKVFVDGNYVLDGPMNNSCAHVLNLCAFLSGREMWEFAKPNWVCAELYRSAPIESEDTNCLFAEMDSGVKICIHLTQSAPQSYPRELHVVGKNGIAIFRDGEGVILPDTFLKSDEKKSLTFLLLREFVLYLLTGEISNPLPMKLKDCEAFLLLSNGAYESAKRIYQIPPEFVYIDNAEDGKCWVVKGIEEFLPKANKEFKLFSELGLSWAKKSVPYFLENYSNFPQRWSFYNMEEK